MRLARRPFISYTSSHFLWYFHVGTFWQFFFFLCYHYHVFQVGLRMKTHAIENPPFYADILWYGKEKLGTSCHANFLLGYEQKTTPNREREKQCKILNLIFFHWNFEKWEAGSVSSAQPWMSNHLSKSTCRISFLSIVLYSLWSGEDSIHHGTYYRW